MTRTIRSMMVCGVVGVAGLVLTGCDSAPRPVPHSAEVSLGDTLQGQTVEVDIVGVNNDTNLVEWEGYNVNDYFKAGDARRAEARKYTMKFAQGSTNMVTLSKDDAVWKDWNKPTHLVILANIPGMSDQGGKATDPRRKVLPMYSNFWEKQELQITVQRSGVKVLTPEKPKKK